ncbi:MAG: amino acid ABC transporter permease [Clostridiales Family XIII bacterium]|jgi:His/Glu/Gln/Arg/opine family amino acid ABC transporter permease subunit|nr:amino acid ABC transporter permease [Clostridiales Family XIII bacterium]
MDFGKTFHDAAPLLLKGLQMTVLAAVVSILIGIVIGFISCMLGRSRFRVLRGISAVYVWVIRGTPMLVQALLIFFGMPQLIQQFIPGFRITALTAAIITLSLNGGAYLSEIFRGGISAVDSGQIEASRSLGMSSSRTMMRIVLPQAIKVAIPSMVNQFIITVKDTSILSAIGFGEIVNKARVYVGGTYNYFATYVLVGLFYLVIISILMVISRMIERKFNYERTRMTSS